MRVARIELPAEPASAATARAYVSAALANSPRRIDVEQVVSEFVAETIAQGAQGEMILTVEHDDHAARVTLTSTENADLRSSTGPEDLTEPSTIGRRFPGLVIANAVADEIGHHYTAATGDSSMWAKFTWTAP